MTSVHVGLPSLRGPLAKYAETFDLLEVRPVDAPLPRPTKLRSWRKEVPPSFVFSVVLPAPVAQLKPSPEAEAALAEALAAAAALEARCMVLVTPPAVTPTELNRNRLRALVQKLPRDAVALGWEPRGIWDVDEAAQWARELDLHLVVDAAREATPRGALLYTRLRGIGVADRLGDESVERVREALRGRREAFVVVESSGASRVAQALRRPLGGTPRAAGGGVILRPPITLSAEDEEQ
ncbi:MAG TPA: DUF72 domain-containing protein [Polyangiaceae bacterium]|nr:DUF72 domain-containing protein [Polyangiaceae bacterium]